MQISYTYKGKPRTLTSPDKWSEMTEAQFVATVRIFKQYPTKPEIIWALPLVLLSIPRNEFLQFNIAYRHQLLIQFQHFAEFKDLPHTWLIPKIRVKNRDWLAPNPKLSDLTFAEFMFLETMLERYQKKNDPFELDRFIAILYRRPIYFGKRPIFAAELVEFYAEKLKNIDSGLKEAILLNYIGWKSNLKNIFRDAFENDGSGGHQKSNWLEQAIRLAEHRQSEVEIIKKTNFYEIMSSLNLRIKDHKQSLKAINTQKP